MRTYVYNNNNYIKLYNADCLEIMQRLVNKGMQVDAIITDPPYGYLDHKLDRKFDNQKFFELAYEIIKKDGFLVFFGRGVENAKRMVIADEVGFKFKEEIVWNKKNTNGLFNNIARVHEMLYVFTKGNGTINKVKKSFLDEIFNVSNGDYIRILKNDLSRIVGKINSINTFEDFVEWKNGNVKIKNTYKYNINGGGGIEFINNVAYGVFNKYNNGSILKTIITICLNRKHTIHPTEKPVKLMEILIELVDNNTNDFTVFDPFAGSCATGVACYNMNKNFIGCEIDNEYFNAAVNRIYRECPQNLFI
ncbi:MAG TPA: site-specific DNA-methyltransferase [Bacteroidales bacterium]|nr:site-specific DNA-methyltransferase [Bacteroidales bacterium]